MKQLNFDNPQKSLLKGKNIIYGAGYNGGLLLKKLEEINVPVEAFYDDDSRRWNERYCGKRIITKEEFVNDKDVNVVISSLYTGQIKKKLLALGFVNVYEVIDFLLCKDTETLSFADYQNDVYLAKIRSLVEQFDDETAKGYFRLIHRSVKEGKALSDITRLYTDEEQYFLDEMSNMIASGAFVDCGAYTGDTLSKCIGRQLYPVKYYCFEADRANYEKLVHYCSGLKTNFEIVAENFALWDVKTRISMKNANYNARVDESGENGDVSTMTLDDYFSDEEKISFIKMDIEGAELKALRGGIRLLKSQRPILAVSIYHSLDDMVNIPEYLMAELEDYRFFIRHHSYTYSETVLYCVPES